MMLIPVVFTATLSGLLLSPYFNFSTNDALLYLLAGTVCCLLLYRFPVWRYLLVFIVFFLFANWRYPYQFPNGQILAELEGQKKIKVLAELKSLVYRTGGRSQLDLKLINFSVGNVSKQVTDQVMVRVFVNDDVTGLLPGDILSFKSRFRKARLFGTPGEFHWPRYLASQGIAMTGWLKNADQLKKVDQSGHFSRGLMEWKALVKGKIVSILPDNQSFFVRALLLGEARVIPDKYRDILSRAGISHLFAISGLHLGLIGVFGYRLLLSAYRRFPRLLEWQPPQRILPLCLLPLLFCYLLLTGDAISTRRALGGAALVAGLLVWRYTVSPLRLLLFLATIFLLANPLLLWQAGWQLSFSGAAGILLWRPLWQDYATGLRKPFRWPLSLCLVSASATLATLPLLILNFNLFSPVGLVANLFAVPVVTLVALPIGLCALLVNWLPVVEAFCFKCCGFLLDKLIVGANWLLSLPGFSGESLYLSNVQLLAVFLLVIPVLAAPQFCRLKNFRLAVSCWLTAFLLLILPLGRHAEIAAYVLSVGQGESILLVNDKQQAILVDGGGLYSERFDVGQRLLAPALGKLGIKKLQAVLLTHDHPDHRKGLKYILQEFEVEEFWSGLDKDRIHYSIKRVLAEQSISVRSITTGWSSVSNWFGSDLSLYFYPDKKNKNNSSVVLLLSQGEEGLLLTGDLEKQGVHRLLASEIPGPVSLLKLPHHGSKHSATEKLIDRIQPDICLVSAGYQNRYRFPAAKLVDYLEQRSIPLYRTDRMGTVRARLRSGKWQVDHWERGLFR